MGIGRFKALVASADKAWQDDCAARFAHSGCDVHIVAAGLDALDLLRRHQYDIIALDNSFPDMNAIEFTLNIKDLAVNGPLTLVGDEEMEKHRCIRRRCNAYFIGPKDCLPAHIYQAVLHLSQNSEKIEIDPARPS